MAEIRWTEESLRCLRSIHDYIESDNPEAAQNIIQGIYEKSQILARFPELGHIYKIEKEGIIRTLIYGHYRIAYLVRDEERIDILGIFHGAMDIDRYLP